MSTTCMGWARMLVTGMGKRIYWVLIALVTVCGMSTLVYFAIQPRPVQKIKISQFETPTVLANSVLLRLREEIMHSRLLLLGVDTNSMDESLQIWKLFLDHNVDPQMRYDIVVMDQFLNDIGGIKDIQKIDTKDEIDRLIQGIQPLLEQGKRVVLIVPTIYAVQMIPGNVANKLKLKFPDMMSISMTDFPRSRAQEKQASHPCIVSGVDVSGVGPFGCLVMQTARGNYLKKFKPGDKIGLVNQIGLNDYLVLYTTESQ